jgi:DNA primase
VGLKCLTGCTRKSIVEAMGLAESDLYVSSKPRALRPLQPGITLIDLAVDKLIHPHLLDQLGVTDCTYKGRQAVRIPYYQQDGSEYQRARLRTALVAKEGSAWSAGKEPLIPYGLQRLHEARTAGYLVIVEGESDCWTLWQFHLPALGLPGAVMYQALDLSMFTGIERVYVMQESDKAGATLPAHISKRLRYLGYTGTISALNLMRITGAKDPNDLLKCDLKSFKTAFEAALAQAELLVETVAPERKRPETFTLAALMQKDLPPVKWAIPGILPEGLTLLCGKPKMGKSWLVLGFALGIACGGYVLGKVKVEPGYVLYLALEDTERRLQRRAKQVLQDARVTPEVLYLAVSWPRLDAGGLEYLEIWLREHPQTRLVIVDTWTKLAPRMQGQKRTQYEEDYDALTPLKELAEKYTLSIVAVTHLRKMQADDVLDEISGTTGFTGAVDGFLVLKRERGQQVATLHVIGRDIEEEQALALTFDQVTATWTLEGKVDEVKMKQRSKERQAMLDLLKAFPQGLSAQEVADHLGKNKYTVRNILKRMVDEQAITSNKGVFTFYEQGEEHPADSERSTQQDGQTVYIPPPIMDTSVKHADLRGYRGYRGYSGSDEAENEPVEGNERMNHGNHAPATDRGYRGSHGSSEESSQKEEKSLNEPVEGNEGISQGSNHDNHANHGNHANRDSSLESVQTQQESNHDNHMNHGNHENHGNHANRDSSLQSHKLPTEAMSREKPERDPQEWEVFLL